MEGAGLYALKFACSCLASQANSFATKEIELQEAMNKSSKFLAEELEEMEKFLAYVDREEAAELVAQSSLDADDTAFFKKIRDMACDIKDCLIDVAPHRERPPLWRLPWASLALRHSIATALEELVSQVNALNQRRERYQCARDRAARKQKSAAEKEARPIVPEIEWKEDLGRLIARPDESLAVISVWLMKGLGSRRAISLVGEVYDDAKEFQCRAWVTATHPISLTKFLKALARQFLANDPATSRGALSALAGTETLGPEQLMGVVARHLGQRRYLVVVEDVCSRPEWDWMKLIFPDDRKGSRIIVTSRRADVARHCVKRTTRSFKLEGAPDDEAMLYVSSDKGEATSGFNQVIKIEPYSEFVGRNEEAQELTRRISWDNLERAALSVVYGANGIGKSTLVRSVYDSRGICWMFERRAWITVMHPFNKEEFLRDVLSQFQAGCSLGWKKVHQSETGVKNKSCDNLVDEICHLMEDGRSLLVVDGLSAKEEWDQVKSCLQTEFGTYADCTVIVTTTSDDVAIHCSGNSSFTCKLSPLHSAAVHQLFYQKVFMHNRLIELCKPMVAHANGIIEKCDGNLLAINIISGLLGTKTRTATEWKKLLERFDSELMKSPNHGVASAAAKLSYHDLPSPMKFLVQYLSIFPRGYNITLSRVARASLAETYRRNARGDNAEEAEDIFDALVTRSMVHPLKRAEITSGRINGCHVNDVFRQLWFSEAKSGFIYILDEETVNNNLSISQIRHLVVTGGWTRDGDQFKKLDLSCARSLTVLGKWNSCFISPSMRSLRVLDLENTEDLVEHHDLEHIGEFRHLKYLGLRNTGIAHLPKSLGKLQGLEELDIRGTYITKLPSTVIRLTRLRRLHGGTVDACYSQLGCPGDLKNVLSSAFCICLLPLCQRHRPSSVRVPEKIGELKSLLTMGTIDAAGSRTVMKEVQKLTQLQKLGVVGVTKRNSKHLCSTLDHLHHLRSLLVHSDGSLSRLDTVTSPSHHLETLKLHGKLGTLPRWIKTLHSLVKLCLSTTLLDADAVQIMAELPKLIVLRLLAKSLVVGEMAFQRDAFPKLELLQLDRLENLMSFSFQRGALPNLEVLQVYNCMFLSEDCLRLYHDLPRIKKVFLDGMLVQKQPGHQERLRKWRKQTDKALQGSTMDLMIEDKKEEIRRKIRAQAHVIRSAFRFKEAGQKYQIRQ
ncbi:unnamed protein product [Urochloa decumbens]|uniref:NB-ARC domain-containing protein n=1 Tax=Urochloa decumbens TaxID=240449 RepID=A0ABC9EAS8_9POAL